MACSVRECEKLVAKIEKLAEGIRKRGEEIDELEGMLRVARTFEKSDFCEGGFLFGYFSKCLSRRTDYLGSENEIIRFSWLGGFFSPHWQKGV